MTRYLQRGRVENSDLARADRPIRAIYKASQGVIHKGLDWQLQKKHVAAFIYHVDRACLKLVKLQEIETGAKPEDCRLVGSESARNFLKQYP